MKLTRKALRTTAKLTILAWVVTVFAIITYRLYNGNIFSATQHMCVGFFVVVLALLVFMLISFLFDNKQTKHNGKSNNN